MPICLEKKFKQAYEKIKSSQNILLITHERPDGDALSCVCAMSLLFDSFKKKHTLFCIDNTPYFYSFLPNINKFIKNPNFNFKNFDLIIILDCGCLDRTGIADIIKNEKESSQYIIEFDHHPHVDDYADLEIRIPEKSSTSEILYYFFKTNHLEITKEISNCILTGILTDTANFLYPSANKESIKISSRMLSCGAAFPKITKKTWQNKSLASMKMLGEILDNLKINKKYNIAFAAMTHEEFKKFEKEFRDNDDIFDLVNSFLSNIKGVKAILFLREEALGRIKGNLRTNHPGIEIIQLAKLLGGGGHPRACGFKIKGHIKKTNRGWEII